MSHGIRYGPADRYSSRSYVDLAGSSGALLEALHEDESAGADARSFRASGLGQSCALVKPEAMPAG